MNGRKGGALLESVTLLPLLLSLMIGTVELARVFYTYYTLEKVMYDLARYIGTQQGVNFCDPADPSITAAENYALTGDTASAQDPVVPGVTPAMFQIAIERYDPVAQTMTPCDCSAAGCDASQGGQPPNYIQVSLTDGYSVQPFFWGFTIDPFPLRPTVTVPYGGT
jgi:TadE-like protein